MSEAFGMVLRASLGISVSEVVGLAVVAGKSVSGALGFLMIESVNISICDIWLSGNVAISESEAFCFKLVKIEFVGYLSVSVAFDSVVMVVFVGTSVSKKFGLVMVVSVGV